jgi:non-heme chloroperoxidase
MRFLRRMLVALIVLPLIVLGGMLVFGTGSRPLVLDSVNSPFLQVNFGDLPAAQMLDVRPATAISYRAYGPEVADEVVIAIHGSTASSRSLHPLSKALAATGIAVYAPDLRGHGATGQKGDVDYLGQPDDDFRNFANFVRAKHPRARLTLIGFSIGGGFVLRTTGGKSGELIDRAILLAPAFGGQAPTMRRADDPWATPHVPRIIALTLLNRVGVHAFDGLEAIAYAVPAGSEKFLTGQYSFRLLRSLMPVDYGLALKSTNKPIKILVGSNDELFDPAKFESAVRPFRSDVPITIVSGVNHVQLTTEPAGINAILAAMN